MGGSQVIWRDDAHRHRENFSKRTQKGSSLDSNSGPSLLCGNSANRHTDICEREAGHRGSRSFELFLTSVRFDKQPH